MRKHDNQKVYFFVDESGDPIFYNKRGKFIVGQTGCSKVLMIGLIKTVHPALKKSLLSFHAKDDCPEIREKIFRTIVDLDFRAEFIVARKKEEVFIKRHHKNMQNFYDDLITKLFENKLHKSNNIIYFAQRGDRKRQEPLENAILKAKLKFEKKWNRKINTDYEIYVQTPVGESCLQVIDYMNWAVQRAFIKRDDRFLNFVMSKIDFLVDIYDFNKYPKNFYNKRNRFNVNKTSPL